MKKINEVQKHFAAIIKIVSNGRGFQDITVFNSLHEIVFQKNYHFATRKLAQREIGKHEGGYVFIGWEPCEDTLDAKLVLKSNRDNLFDTESIAVTRSCEHIKKNLDANLEDRLEEIEFLEGHNNQ